jgi:hypothetical protein
MSLQRLRRGELLVAFGLLGLAASLVLRWFEFDRVKDAAENVSFFGTTDTGWGYLGAPWILLLVLVAVAATATLITAARAGAGRPTFGAVTAVIVAVVVAAVGFLLLLLRVLVATPTPALDDLGRSSILSTLATSENQPDLSRLQAELSPAVGAWVGLASVLAILVGLWLAMSDDRSTAAESVAVPPPAPRAVPALSWTPPAPAEPADGAVTRDAEAAPATADATTASSSDPEPPAPPASAAALPAEDPAPASDPAPDPDPAPAEAWTPSPESPVPPEADAGPGRPSGPGPA